MFAPTMDHFFFSRSGARIALAFLLCVSDVTQSAILKPDDLLLLHSCGFCESILAECAISCVFLAHSNNARLTQPACRMLRSILRPHQQKGCGAKLRPSSSPVSLRDFPTAVVIRSQRDKAASPILFADYCPPRQ